MRISPSYRTGNRLKPTGMPVIGAFGVPRGLALCIPFATASFHAARNLTNGTPVGGLAPAFIGGSTVLKPTKAGAGVQCIGTGAAFTVGYGTAPISTPFSIEILFYSGAVITSAALGGINKSSDGTSGNYDKTLAFNAAGQLSAYVYNGGGITATDTTTTYAINTIYHVGMTVNGVNLILYLNGYQVASVACTTTDSSYGASAFFCIGGTRCNFISPDATNTSYATILLANIANVAWTPAEWKERALNPFGFLEWAGDWLMGFEAGGTSITARSRSLIIA